jgi:hypothetical protein
MNIGISHQSLMFACINKIFSYIL